MTGKQELSTSKQLKVVIVDDEEIACANLQQILCEYVDPEIQFCGTARDTAHAGRLITAARPDVVFLDIEMPNENAFGLLERLSPYSFEVIFITAYDKYAIQALRLNAFDYILKPISIVELTQAVNKLKEMLGVRATQPEQHVFQRSAGKGMLQENRQQIALRGQQQIEIVHFWDIVYLEGLGGYSKFYYYKNKELRSILMSHPILEYETVLPSDLFFRIHKSYLLNCAHVSGIQKENTPFALVGEDLRLPVSRRRYSELMQFLKSHVFRHV
jgi:two-component system LytT family response regulator